MPAADVQAEIDELRAEIKRLLARPTLDDLDASIFARFVERSEANMIPSNKAVIHTFFSALAADSQAPAELREILSELTFEVGDYCPFSRELEGAIMRLQLGGLMSAMNPDFRSYTMSETQRDEAVRRVSTIAGVEDYLDSAAATLSKDVGR